MSDAREFLEQHLQSIFNGDVEGCHATTHPDLTLVEWTITPHRIGGLPFHDFMLEEAGRKSSVDPGLVPQPELLNVKKHPGSALIFPTIRSSVMARRRSAPNPCSSPRTHRTT